MTATQQTSNGSKTECDAQRNSMMDYLDIKQPITLSNPDELIANLDNEALLTKFLDVNAKFIAVGPLHQQFQKLEYAQIRDELCRIDVEIRHRALLGTPEYRAAVRAAHDQAWQLVRMARPCAPVRQSQEAGRQIGSQRDPVVVQGRAPASTSAIDLTSQTADRERADPVVRQDAPLASTGAEIAASNAVDREATDTVGQQETPPASSSAVPNRAILATWRDAVFALGHRRREHQ
jgi:hypothetical protein